MGMVRWLLFGFLCLILGLGLSPVTSSIQAFSEQYSPQLPLPEERAATALPTYDGNVTGTASAEQRYKPGTLLTE